MLTPSTILMLMAHLLRQVIWLRQEPFTLFLVASANKLAVSSTKSMVGHLLAAAGAVEAVFSVLSLRDQLAPPTINLDNPSEGCDLDYVPHTTRDMKIDTVMTNSFGFGGTNGTLVFSKI